MACMEHLTQRSLNLLFTFHYRHPPLVVLFPSSIPYFVAYVTQFIFF